MLVICVGQNIIFDPSAEEIAAAETIVAITVAEDANSGKDEEEEGTKAGNVPLTLRAMRTIDPPARMSQPGAPDAALAAERRDEGIWNPPRGGVKRELITKMVKMVLEKRGVGEEVLAGLETVNVG